MSAHDELMAVLATVRNFADRGGAERVVVLLDADPPLLVELREDGALEVTEGEQVRSATVPPGVEPLPLPDLRPVPATALTADPETGELAAPLGSLDLLVSSVQALAQAVGGRSVATATFATRDPEMPLTIAARAGEPVVLDIAGRHFTFPA